MQVVILAGGLGTRLRPSTFSTPKCMMRVANRPFIAHLLENVQSQGFTNIHICTGYLSDKVKKFVGDGSEFGISVTYSEEERPLGTGGALRNAGPFLEQEILLIQGDTYNKVNLKDLVAYYKANKCDALMVTSNNDSYADIFNTSINRSKQVTYYSKDRNEIGSNLMNCVDMGTYIFNRDFLFRFFPNNTVFSLEQDVFKRLISSRAFYCYATSSIFYDMGTPEGVEDLEKALK